MMNGKNVALVAAAGVIAYLIYLYEKKKTAVASQIKSFQATSTPVGTPITDQVISPMSLPINSGPSAYINLLPSYVPPPQIQLYADTQGGIATLPIDTLNSYSPGAYTG